MSIVVVGLSHHTSPVTLRECFAFSEEAIPAALAQLRSAQLAEEAVILSTCNRVELYAVTSHHQDQAFAALERFLIDQSRHQGPVQGEIYALAEPASVEHLFRVASGLDSMVLGETEILGQIKKAYQIALQHNHTGGGLNKAFQKAFNVAKQIRTDTRIQRGSISVGSVAVELAEKIFSALSDRHVLVIGAGDTSEKTARALIARGAQSVIVSNRSHDRALALASELGGRAVRFEDWTEEFDRIDIVISSTSAPHYVLDRTRLVPIMKRRRNRSLLLIDIAVPRDIDPEVNFLENVYLYNIDDLQSIAEGYLQQRREEVTRCEIIIRERTAELLAALKRPPGNAPPKTIQGSSGLADSTAHHRVCHP